MNWRDLDPLTQLKKTQAIWDNPIYFITDPYFLGETPRPVQAEIISEFYRDLNTYDTLVLAAGRRSGKTWIGGTMSAYEQALLLSLPDPAKYYGLSRGSNIFIVNMAVSEDQSKDTVFAETKKFVKNSPYLQSFQPEIYSTEIRYPTKNVIIKALGSTGASGVGRTCKMVFLDEIAKFEETTSERSQWEVYYNMSAATKTFGMQGHTIIISSVKHENDLLWTLYKRSKLMANILGYKFATWEMNPHITRVDLQASFDIDPAAAAREWGATPHKTSDTYFARQESVNEAFTLNSLNALDPERNPPMPADVYVLGLDPASRVDAFGFALARFNATWGIDYVGLHRMVPTVESELSPTYIAEYVMDKINAYQIMYVVIDTPMFPSLREQIYNNGSWVEIHQLKKEHYDQFKESIYTGRAKAIPYTIAQDELKALMLIRANRVDHPPRGSKDVADAMANVHWMLTESALIEYPEEIFHGQRGTQKWIRSNLDTSLNRLQTIPVQTL